MEQGGPAAAGTKAIVENAPEGEIVVGRERWFLVKEKRTNIKVSTRMEVDEFYVLELLEDQAFA